MIPGWPYPGSWRWSRPRVVDAAAGRGAPRALPMTPPRSRRAQLRGVAERIIAAGHWREGDPDIIVVLDSGYGLTRLAPAAGLPARVDVGPGWSTPRPGHVLPGSAAPGTAGGSPRAGGGRGIGASSPSASRLTCRTWPSPPSRTRPGTAPRPRWPGPGCTSGWNTAAAGRTTPKELPVVEGTLIRLAVDHLPGQRDADPVRAVAVFPRRAPQAKSTAPGRRSCAASTSSTPSGSSSSSSAGPARSSATRPPPTAGLARHRLLRPAVPGPRPRRRHPTALAAAPQRPPGRPPRPARGTQGFAASARTCPFPPARRNPPSPAPAAPPAEEPATCHPPRRGQTVKPEPTPRPRTSRQTS